MIMCANGVPEELIIEIFAAAVADIRGLKSRVQSGRATKEDYSLMSSCKDVSRAHDNDAED